MWCLIRAERGVPFSFAWLSSLTLLQVLTLNRLGIGNFRLPWRVIWGRLHTLDLAYNCLPHLPEPLGPLESLVSLSAENQSVDFQLERPMHFITRIHSLRKVNVRQESHRNLSNCWGMASLMILVQARLAIRKTPTCHVELVD